MNQLASFDQKKQIKLVEPKLKLLKQMEENSKKLLEPKLKLLKQMEENSKKLLEPKLKLLKQMEENSKKLLEPKLKLLKQMEENSKKLLEPKLKLLKQMEENSKKLLEPKLKLLKQMEENSKKLVEPFIQRSKSLQKLLEQTSRTALPSDFIKDVKKIKKNDNKTAQKKSKSDNLFFKKIEIIKNIIEEMFELICREAEIPICDLSKKIDFYLSELLLFYFSNQETVLCSLFHLCC